MSDDTIHSAAVEQKEHAPAIAPKEFTLDDFIEAAGGTINEGEVAFRIAYRHARTDELIGHFPFKALSAPVYRKFQDIATGTIKRKANRAEAVRYIFDKCCLGFELADENARLNTGKHLNAKAMFLGEPKLEMVIDAAVNEYLGEARPTVEDVKK